MIRLRRNLDENKRYTLIVPAVAVGNVAQLAVDLLIYNGSMKKIGQVFTPDFIPLLGADPYDPSCPDPCTTADFYVNEEKETIALQIRSPPPFSKLNDFFSSLGSFVEEHRISKVIILTSEWRYTRIHGVGTSQEETTRYVASPAMERLCGRSPEHPEGERSSEIHGGGFASRLFEYLTNRDAACAVLVKYSSEGDNSRDAKELAGYCDRWTSLVPGSDEESFPWKEPPSWRHVFGHEPPGRLY